MQIEEQGPALGADEIQELIRDRLKPRFAALEQCHSVRELRASPLYQSLEPEIRRALETPQTGSFAPGPAPSWPRYRIVAWNVERGKQLSTQLEAFQTHPYLSTADVFLLTETDVGMARSHNADIARSIARVLGFHYAFIPCYLSLVKGSGLERHIDGENDLGLHGNAIVSRYPIVSPRPVHLENGIDLMAAREKRLGCQTALVAAIDFPQRSIQFACAHLDAHSTQKHRKEQMEAVLKAMPAGPALIGGDWNTTTYNSSTAFHSIMGFWLRVMLGVGYVIRNHYLHPDRWFERRLFRLLDSHGFDYRRSNVIGEHTLCYDIRDRQTFTALAEWVPLWCFPFIHWSLRNHGGRCPLKLDWFATRGLRVENPAVLHDVREGRAVPLSDHDAIAVELVLD